MGQNSNYLKAIKELEGYEFVVPSYQRGYRWGKQEVKALLEDIYDFIHKKYEIGDLAEYFYCLQPIVVRELSPKSFNVIDGQQRLTTIFLILKYLDGGGENFFSLDYETRGESREFLRGISQNVALEDTGNTDFEHFKNAYEVIGEFFEDKAEGDMDRLKRVRKALLESCKVLWYAVGGNEGDEDKVETKVFIRLNTGKIPLTLAENVKALFLLDDGKTNVEVLEERARFWHETEINARRDDDFAYLVLSKIEPKDLMELKEEKRMILKDDVMRIEAYLKLVCPNENLFDFYYRKYKQGRLSHLYDELQGCVQGLRSFVSNKDGGKIEREIYHSIGFLVQNGIKPNELYTAWDNADDSKSDFLAELNKKVRDAMVDSIKDIDKLEYTDGKGAQEKLKNILLLFNLEHANMAGKYFEFNYYQLEKWELEHIYPQNSKAIQKAIKEDSENVEQLKGCLMELVEYMDGELRNSIKKYSDELDFAGILENKGLFDKIDDALEAKSGLDSIGNLTLLDKRANSGVGNLVFYKKRLKIDELEGEKRFIPIATKKVFVKDFSKQNGNPFVFTLKDQEDYLNAIKKALQKFTK